MTRIILTLIGGIVALLIVFIGIRILTRRTVNTYDTCRMAGYNVENSNPKRCTTPNGIVYVEPTPTTAPIAPTPTPVPIAPSPTPAPIAPPSTTSSGFGGM